MKTGKIGFWEAFSIGVGGMIGGGIFAVLGLTMLLARGGAPIAFLLAGIVALLTSYSYAKLSVRYPSEGGSIEYMVKAFGGGLLSGWLNLLLLASYVVMLALYAYAFGSYVASMLPGGETHATRSALALLVVAGFTLVNALGARVAGSFEDALVAFKLGVLALFSAAGLLTADLHRLQPSSWAPPASLLAGGLVIFLAYEGFELIANTAHDVGEPEKTLPKAFYASVLLVIAVYVAVSAVAVANLDPSQVVRYKDYALAVAAKPSLGQAGFALIGAAAAVSTSSAINATLYGSARVSYMVSKYGELPKTMGRIVWREAYEGLLVVSALSAIAAALLDIGEIAVAGSLGFLIIFASVNVAAAKLHKSLRSRRVLHLAGAAACTLSAAVLVLHTYETGPRQLLVLAVFILAPALVEEAYRSLTGRRISEFIDWRLRERVSVLLSWESWAYRAAGMLKDELRALEVHLVGSVARGELDKAHDLDLLVVSEKPITSRELAGKVSEIAGRLGLPPHHPLHVHVTSPEKKGYWLRKSAKSRRLA